MPTGTPPARKHFWQLAAFTHQLRSSGPPFSRAFQATSNNVTNYLSHTASGRGKVIGKFNFRVITEGGVSGLGGEHVGESVRSLFQP